MASPKSEIVSCPEPTGDVSLDLSTVDDQGHCYEDRWNRIYSGEEIRPMPLAGDQVKEATLPLLDRGLRHLIGTQELGGELAVILCETGGRSLH